MQRIKAGAICIPSGTRLSDRNISSAITDLNTTYQAAVL